MQLAGKPCGICEKPISGRTDGAFCPRCLVPVHVACQTTPPDGGGCQQCGTGRATIDLWDRLHEDKAGRSRWADGTSQTRYGIWMLLVGGLSVLSCIMTGAVGPAVGALLVCVGAWNLMVGRRKIVLGREQVRDSARQ